MAFPRRTRDRIVPLMASRMVTVVPPDPAWPARFEREAARVRALFGDAILELHHAGSTSVPGLWAKPIVDIVGFVRSLDALAARRPAAEADGFTWRGEYGIPRRCYLRTDDLHVHLYEPGNRTARRNLAFRDHLRANAAARDAYAALKRELAARFAHDRDAYQDGKSELVEALLREAMGDAYIGP
jgi:GrpB-like predicted nucleotidyltransferase (UPF0157 family)